MSYFQPFEVVDRKVVDRKSQPQVVENLNKVTANKGKYLASVPSTQSYICDQIR